MLVARLARAPSGPFIPRQLTYVSRTHDDGLRSNWLRGVRMLARGELLLLVRDPRVLVREISKRLLSYSSKIDTYAADDHFKTGSSTSSSLPMGHTKRVTEYVEDVCRLMCSPAVSNIIDHPCQSTLMVLHGQTCTWIPAEYGS